MQRSIVDQRRHGLSEHCSLCQNAVTIFDEDKCEVICSDCGPVVNEGWELAHSMASTASLLKADKSGNRSRDSLKTPLTFHDMGLSTSISNSATDANGAPIDPAHRPAIYRMKRLNKFSGNRSRQRSLTAAFYYLNQLKEKLALTDAIVQKAAYNYRKALSLNLVKGRSINAMVVASAYAACREFNSAKTIGEMANAIEADLLLSRRCFRLIMQSIDMNAPKVGASMFLNRAANALQITGRDYRDAIRFLDKLTGQHVSQGKNPKALAAASLYMACNRDNPGQITLAAVANATDISIVSIRKRVAEIKEQGLA